MQKFCFWWNENRLARSKFHCIGIGFKAIIKGRNTQHLIRVMKVEVLWWLSGRAPATLGIVNWPLNTGWRFFFFAPCKGIRKFIACGIRNPGGDFAYGIWNPEFWNQEYRSRLESRIQVLLTNTGIQYLSGIGNPQRGIQNPRLFRIPETGNFLLVESGILEVIFLMESGIQLKESGIHWNPVPGIRNPQRGMQNPRLSWILLHGTRQT